jgi:NAD(P)-dependent dehydrogenase (short-subunit alcohol dehydrogenase family)
MGETNEYFRDKVATITGGASGIGLALAETMLSYGAKRVVLADVNEANLVRETARLNAAYPGEALGIRCDVTNEEEVKGMIKQAAEFGDGRIDLLFNNAGTGFRGDFLDQTDGDWEKAFALNFYGAVYGIRAVLPVMRAQGGGPIVNIISGMAFSPMAYQTMYAATKAALNALTLTLRYEFWDENIRLTSATPGTTATAIWSAGSVGAPPGAQSPERSARAILSGVAKKERLVLGDEADALGARACFNPEAAKDVDEYLLNVARKRRSGEWAV